MDTVGDILGETLFRLFYKNKDDLLDIVVLYSRRGSRTAIVYHDPAPKRRRDEKDKAPILGYPFI